ncbi:putative glycosyl hydrolase protein [Phaeoacremonium minimum UCRPA7]|uniref:Putative glycosyl hydrolase protein n=1 Tax=Phaeoacremonium minimum (strain UCR-PA7) TaxID=1286976 RepID=R8BLC9_PHAM7|nr:putative glycosyl hydrolase protein [Phaeoacremonium minimum UCRPA7]EOO00168.1 putative glycosyl hydrolase protein [Phaeoacremonium minimum UCRPA7]
MNGYYNLTDGRWSTVDAWWLTGNALQAILDFMYKTGNRQYMDMVLNTIEKQKEPLPWYPEGGGIFRSDSTDDTGWWALAMVRAFDLTGNQRYLDYAILDEEYIYSYWNTSSCGGGVPWQIPTRSYKNAISNELHIKLAASIHNRIPGDRIYLERALQAWEWFRGSGMINADHLINDGLAESNGTCFNNGQTTWTYNQGVILGGLTELFRAVGEPSYLAEAREIADAVISSETLSPNGVLTEPCDPAIGCNADQANFKGIFARNLAELDAVLADHPYHSYLVTNARTMVQNDRNATDYYGIDWRGPIMNSTLGSQISAVSLLSTVI